MLVIFLLTISLLAYWMIEFNRHQRILRTIPIRIHVNGTRGKSSVTRLIAAGLRAGGKKTLAKTTGTLPRIIDENGLEIPVPRPHGVNIIEQLDIVRFMNRRSPEVIVLECMAVLPQFQWICEHQMVKSTVGVFTNSRLDHVREMGPSIENITRSLCNTLPKNGIAFTSEKKNLPLMLREAEKLNTKLSRVASRAVENDEMANFSYIEHKANVALALAVCEHLGVERKTALKGMYDAHPDAGAMNIYQLQKGETQVFFISALAANDPESTLEIWRALDEIHQDRSHLTVMLNTRADRFDRSIQLLEICQAHIPFDELVFIGEKLEQVVSNAIRLKIRRDKFVLIKSKSPEEAFNRIIESAPPTGKMLVFAIGNMGGGGLQVANYFKKQANNIENCANIAPH
ncbi:MAG: poly-gamma-glutamate synthase PgsB [candidate division Zixibacteria bacterium]|nr:poly-gamma-glutamate synthase PgsB [Candidatus Tariuqbacter arcticus]